MQKRRYGIKVSRRDRTTRKPIDKFKQKYFKHKSKKCVRCGRRKERQHHYLCQRCWNKNHQEWVDRQTK